MDLDSVTHLDLAKHSILFLILLLTALHNTTDQSSS